MASELKLQFTVAATSRRIERIKTRFSRFRAVMFRTVPSYTEDQINSE